MSRKIFNYDNLNESRVVTPQTKKTQSYVNSISACGCVFYKIEDNKVKLLLIKYTNIKKNNKLDDFGGKVDNVDMSVYQTIARETSEETNDLISKQFILDQLSETKYVSFYTQSSKYYFIAIQVSNDFFPNTEIFGNDETYEKIPRTVHWFDYALNKKKIAKRLSDNNEFITFLDNLVLKCVATQVLEEIIQNIKTRFDVSK